MRIGLLTYHWVPNYGANLQTLSTYEYLENNGYDPVVVNWVPEDTFQYYLKYVGARQMAAHENFASTHFRMTERFSDWNDIDGIMRRNGITHIVIGSDSLFNLIKESVDASSGKVIYPTADHRFPNPFWGDGLDNFPHAALSVSCQNAHYQNFADKKEEIGRCLDNFKVITVRDNWTAELVRYFTDGKISPCISPDPVFAFNANVSKQPTKEEILKKFGLDENYVLFAFNPSRRYRASVIWQKRIKMLFHKRGYQCVSLPLSVGSQKLVMDKTIEMPVDPIDWYGIIKYSSGYVGLLMHPIVVCIHNSVPFFSFDQYGDGPMFKANPDSSKIYHILKSAGLLSNHLMIKNHPWYPRPSKLVDLIINFDKESCSSFSVVQQMVCEINMKMLINRLFHA